MTLSISLWQIVKNDTLPIEWHDAWMSFEDSGLIYTHSGIGTWDKKNGSIDVNLPWNESAETPNAIGDFCMVTSFKPCDFKEHLLKRSENDLAWGSLMQWIKLEVVEYPFSLDDIESCIDDRQTLELELQRLELSFDLLMSPLQTVINSISANEIRWLIPRKVFSNQELFIMLSEIKENIYAEMNRIVADLADIMAGRGEAESVILQRLRSTYAYHYVSILRATLLRDIELYVRLINEITLPNPDVFGPIY